MLGQAIGAFTNATHGMTLSAVSMAYYKKILPYGVAKFARFAKNVWGVESQGKSDRDIANQGLWEMEKYMRELGLVMNISELGAVAEQISDYADKTVVFDTGYKVLSREEIEEIFKASL